MLLYFITVGNVSTTPTQFSSLGWKKNYMCVSINGVLHAHVMPQQAQ